MVMKAWDNPRLQSQVNAADLVLADGQPMVWALRLLGVPQRQRVRVSTDFLFAMFERAGESGTVVGLYGGTPETLEAIKSSLHAQFPELRLGYAYAPPFRPLTAAEDDEVVADIRSAGVAFLLVGIGCPKQEHWMSEHADRMHCVMMGVGAAFDVFAGKTKEAPSWTRDVGLEWVYRLTAEPRRLWKRHLKNNPRFMVLLALQVLSRYWNVRATRSRSCGSELRHDKKR
jgi:N-acetylglucosaminyldiphosphoundecaprenol N-acetyl-beta-D-mannosaminyltransferase